MKHIVNKNEYCYYCLRCGKASGDGDGLVGKKCAGKDLTAVAMGSISTKKKAVAARENGKLGGRPKKLSP